MSGSVNDSWSTSYHKVLYDGVYWRRFDWTCTVTNTWAGSVLTDLYYVVPWVWTGPLLAATAGPWTAATWDDTNSWWTSNRTGSLGNRVFLAAYQTSTLADLQLYSTYTTMAYYPMSTDSSLTPVATHAESDQVYTFAVPSVAYGESVTFSLSLWVEYNASGSLPESRFDGSFMGTGCLTS